MHPGDIVKSRDARDEGRLFIVHKTGVSHVSGPCAWVTPLPDSHTVYRLERDLYVVQPIEPARERMDAGETAELLADTFNAGYELGRADGCLEDEAESVDATENQYGLIVRTDEGGWLIEDKP